MRELERQGVSREVSADMFGMGLRSYLRRIQRLGESSTERGRSLWEVVRDFLQERGVVTRAVSYAGQCYCAGACIDPTGCPE